MPLFRPPTEDVVPPVYLAPDAYRPVPKLSQRLFRFYRARPQGRNIFKLTDGTYTETQPYPYIDASTQPGQPADTTVAMTYLGGHVYHVDNAEAARLIAAGYSVDVTKWSDLTGTWGDLSIYPWNEL